MKSNCTKVSSGDISLDKVYATCNIMPAECYAASNSNGNLGTTHSDHIYAKCNNTESYEELKRTGYQQLHVSTHSTTYQPSDGIGIFKKHT